RGHRDRYAGNNRQSPPTARETWECRWPRGHIPTRQPPGEQGQTAHSKKLPHKLQLRRITRAIARETESLSIAHCEWLARSRSWRLSLAPLLILRCTRELPGRAAAIM